MGFVIVDADKYDSTVSEQFVQQAQAGPHHRAPLVVTQAVLDADRVFAEPLLHHRAVHVVVVAPTLIACVVGRVDEDAIDLARVHRKQRLQRVQVVAVQHEVAIEPGVADRFRCVRNQRPVGNGKVVVENELLAFEAECRHTSGGLNVLTVGHL